MPYSSACIVLTYLHIHNNACERALRPSVIHRKVMGSFRSDWGAQAYAALATVLNTAKRNGQSAFLKLVQLMGMPVLPFFQQPSYAGTATKRYYHQSQCVENRHDDQTQRVQNRYYRQSQHVQNRHDDQTQCVQTLYRHQTYNS